MFATSRSAVGLELHLSRVEFLQHAQSLCVRFFLGQLGLKLANELDGPVARAQLKLLELASHELVGKASFRPVLRRAARLQRDEVAESNELLLADLATLLETTDR